MCRIIDSILTNYIDEACIAELADLAVYFDRNDPTFYLRQPVVQENEDPQTFSYRYIKRWILRVKLNALLDFDSDDFDNSTVDLIDVRDVLEKDSDAYSLFIPQPGSHVGFAMSQVICSPLTQTYLDQAHGNNTAYSEFSFVDNEYKILNAAFMGYKFKIQQWDYFEMNTSLLSSLDNSNGWFVVLGARMLAVDPEHESHESGLAVYDKIVKEFSAVPLTVNTVMRMNKRYPRSLCTFKYFFNKIHDYLNEEGNALFDCLLVLFVNHFCKSSNVIKPFNRRRMNTERDVLSQALFECPFPCFLVNDRDTHREMWPLAATVVGVKSHVHGSNFYGSIVRGSI